MNMFDFLEDFQYDSCTSKGVCSINPRTSALQGVLVLYLKFIGKYALALFEKENLDKSTRELILNTVTITISNSEFTETSFTDAVSKFKDSLPEIIVRYNEITGEKDFERENLETLDLFKETNDIISAIRFGESALRKALLEISPQVRDLYNIMLVISKSISINLLDLESFGKSCEDGYYTVIKLFNMINLREESIDTLKSEIYSASEIDDKIMTLLKVSQEERYGRQGEADVSYSTLPSKAVLVAGSNIRELETVLEALKDTDIDVYTHDDMMIAHTFPKFKEYKNLKGQFGQGLENCLLDFATFPGPIILTKHSLHNIDNLYRGRLFTTDFTCPKGVIRIKNDDYKEVIASAQSAKGFKRGRQCETVTIGYVHETIMKNIKEKLESGKYKKIFIVGLEKYSLAQKSYFEKLMKLIPGDIYVISFSYNFEKENSVHINTCFDNFSIMRIYKELNKLNLPIVVFVPKCDRNSISQMIYLSQRRNTKVFAGECTPIILNPSLMNTLQLVFSVRSITSAKRDFDEIIIN